MAFPVVIDTDPGWDDAVAIFVALKYLNVVGITTTFGNSSIDNTTRNLMVILEEANRTDIPVYIGASNSLVCAENEYAEFVHGENGLHGLHKDPDMSVVKKEKAAVALNRLAEEYSGKLIVITLGPATNVAFAHRLEPNFSKHVHQLYMMGGCDGRGQSLGKEFNCRSDPESWDIAMSEFVCPTWVFTWESCLDSCQFSATDIRNWNDKYGTNVARFLTATSKTFDKFMCGRGLTGFPLCDVAPIAAVHSAALVTGSSQRSMFVNTVSGLFKGASGIDWNDRVKESRRAISIVTKMDDEGIRKMVYGMLNSQF